MKRRVFKESEINQSLYRIVFWIGYIMVFVQAFIPIKNDFHEIAFSFISVEFHFDQVLHAIVFLLIVLYVIVGEYFGLTLFKDNYFTKFLLVILILSTITEAVQIPIPSRSFNIFDWLANLVGILAGLVIWKIGGKDFYKYSS